MLPGPQITAGIPAWWNSPPSVPKATVEKSVEPLSRPISSAAWLSSAVSRPG